MSPERISSGSPALRLDEVAEHTSWADGRQLVGVADPHDRRGVGQRGEEVARELDVDHRGLVEDEDVALETVLGIVGEAVRDGVPLEEPVNRLRRCAD